MKNENLKSTLIEILSSTLAFASVVSIATLLYKGFELGTLKAFLTIVLPVLLAAASAFLKLRQIHRFSDSDSAKNATPVPPR